MSLTSQVNTSHLRSILHWMQSDPDRLRALLAEEAADAVPYPAGDAAIRAHLRFVAEALAATTGGGQHAPLEAFAARLPAVMAEPRRLEAELELMGEAAEHELRLQFGAAAAQDPSLRVMARRRVRIGAWHRVFLRALEDALGSEAASAHEALTWMANHQTVLADTIFAMDKHAKQLAVSRAGPDAVADVAVVNQIGHEAALRAHTRFLAEALVATLRLDD